MKKLLICMILLLALLLTGCDKSPTKPEYRPVTSINFSLNNQSQVNISIFDSNLEFVKLLVSDELDPGNHQFVWIGDNDDGNKVASGIYYYVMIADNYVSMKGMLLLN